MLYAISGTDPDFLGFALFDQFDNLSIELVSANSTSIVISNSATGAITTLTGFGFTFSGENPTGGVITSATVSDGSSDVGSISNINWSLVAFDQALQALDSGNEAPIAALINSSGGVTVDASGATGPLNSEEDLEGILELLNTGYTYIDSPFDEDVGGTNFNDTYRLGTQNDFTSINIEATLGNDIFDFTGASSNAFAFLDYDQDYSTPQPITANINGVAGTGTVSTGSFTDTILGLGVILGADGFGIGGSNLNDTFNVTLGSSGDNFQFMSVTGGEGSDVFNINLGANSTVRLDFRFGAFNNPFTGVVMDIAAGTISNDGFGSSDTINYTYNGGRLEIRGTDLADDITGSDFNDSFILREGNDTVDGGDGFDRVRYDRSGVEAVTVDLSTGVATGTWNGNAFTHDLTSIEWVRGSREGNDTLIGSDANEILDGRGGDDSLVGGGGNDTLYGDDGNDIFLSGSGNDVAQGGSGNDTMFGGDNNDHLSATSGANEMFGGSGNDTIEGGVDGDLMGGGGGFDILNGGNGNDTMFGSSGNDTIEGGEGDDFAGAGSDNDLVNGGNGNDTLYGGGNRDVVNGGNNDDLLGGGAGRDVVDGGSGNDTLWGQAGDDTLFGGQGDDDIAGGGQGDLLVGQQGDDTLNGGFGNDTLSGGADDDVLNGNFGNDVLTGGIGADTFVFDANGSNTVTDFSIADGDVLQIDDAFWMGMLTAQQVIDTYADDSSGTVIFDFGTMSITLNGVSSVTGLENALDII